MPYYTFVQNNSGGFFKLPAQYVIVEANSADEANAIAENKGLYFNGVEEGPDCPCCGDRWYKVYDSDATDKPEIYEKSIEDFLEENSRFILSEKGIPFFVVFEK